MDFWNGVFGSKAFQRVFLGKEWGFRFQYKRCAKMLGFWQIWGAKWRMSFAQHPVTWISSEILLQLNWGQGSTCSNLQKPLKAWNLTSSWLPFGCGNVAVGWGDYLQHRCEVSQLSQMFIIVSKLLPAGDSDSRSPWRSFPPKNGRTHNFASKSWIQDEDSSWRGASWMLSYMLERFFWMLTAY